MTSLGGKGLRQGEKEALPSDAIRIHPSTWGSMIRKHIFTNLKKTREPSGSRYITIT